jgi:5'-methylthioadenosine phosphorylase
LGTEEIFATTAVGSLNPEMKAGHFVVCDNVLDFTKSRINTFYDTPERGVVHVDFSYPYCQSVREKVIKCLEGTDITFHRIGTYVCTEGPRFESAAEIKMFAMLGGDVVGMTNMPECILAREAEMCYSTCSIVTNMAAGISPTPLSHMEVVEAMGKSISRMNKLIEAFIAYNEPVVAECDCHHALREFGGFKL